MVDVAQTQAATLDKFIQGWSSWTPEPMLAVETADCTQTALPFSMGHPPRSKAEVEFMLPKLMKTVQDYKLTIHNVVHDTANRKAAVYAISHGNTDFGEWTNEYAVFVWFTEDGTRISKIEEMVDSAFMKDFMPKFQRHLMTSGMLTA
ncbi:hypothetical protein AMS68_004766 [Peltaster fructicola]|uniref:SnoaL-like domain-containing protein n=1 Tax=Peltaster fructicola TaxID=286661 RepID=A0A6H0XXA1_9PEZI|nr:hypothetical protein AMS68_004766 [Peltaster fructicola]